MTILVVTAGGQQQKCININMRHTNQEPKSGRNLYHHGSLPGARRQICDLGHFSVPLLKGTSSILATFRISRHICYHRRMNRRSCHDSIEFIIDIYIYIWEAYIATSKIPHQSTALNVLVKWANSWKIFEASFPATNFCHVSRQGSASCWNLLGRLHSGS